MAQMTRLFVAEEAAERALSLAAATAPAEGRTGLLLGLPGNSSTASSPSNRDVVLLAVPTPARDDDEEEEEDGERAGEAWAAEHARIVRRMLPGGVAILGVFLAFPGGDGDGGDTEKRQAKLRRLLFVVERALARGRPPQGRGEDYDDDDDDDEADGKQRAALLAVGPGGRRWCSSYDVRDAQAAAARAEWKLRPKPPQHQQQQQPLLVELRCSLHLELRAPLSPPGGRAGGASTAGALRAATRQLAGQLRRAACLVDGRFLRDDEAIGLADGGGGGGARRRLKQQQQQQQRPSPPIAVRMLLPPPRDAPGAAASPSAGVPCPHGLLQIVGSASCRAFVNPQQRALLAGPALRALKADAIASLWTRCELLLEEEEELVGAGRDDTDTAKVKVLPRRVFVPVPGLWGARLCHFAFPDETAADCAARVGEVLGLELAGQEEVEEAEEVVAMVVEEEEAPGPIVTADGADGDDGSGGACGPEAMRRRRRKEEEEKDGRGGVRGEVCTAGRLYRSSAWLVVGAGVAVVTVLLLLYAAVAD